MPAVRPLKDLTNHHIPSHGPRLARRSLLPSAHESLDRRERSLLDMLTYKRPHGSRSERKFINRFIRPLGVKEDGFGNLIKIIGTSPVLWSSHTDTVHRDQGRQSLHMTEDGTITSWGNDCLGADCAAGVWIMCEMIRLGIEGTYVFHRDEENGGTGSTWITQHTPELLKGIDYAIAFDRKGYSSVITHQWGGRGCSDGFAKALCVTLGSQWRPDSTGTFTDTANYFEFIPECTNVSVGYEDQHTKQESLFLPFIVELLDNMAAMNIGDMPVIRDPVTSMRGDDDYWQRYVYSGRYCLDNKGRYKWDEYEPKPNNRDHRSRLIEAIADHPEVVYDILDEMGLGADEILMRAYGSG